MASLRWTIGARADLAEVHDFIARDSEVFALATAEQIVAAAERLTAHSRIGRVVPEYDLPALRELIVGNYRVVYHVTPREVAILAVVHASRDLLRALGPAPWLLP